MKDGVYEPDEFGDWKISLVDFMSEELGINLDYRIPSHDLMNEIALYFGVNVRNVHRKKAKRVLKQFMFSDVFSVDAFLRSYVEALSAIDQNKVKSAIKILGGDQYHRFLGNYMGELNKDDIPIIATAKNFYQSPEWIRLRYQALRVYGNSCQCCGRKAGNGGIWLEVDHVIPRSYRPDLALDLVNLQILCNECNTGKMNVDITDWRAK